MFREPITIDDVLGSRLIAYPFHLLECCLVTDGGGALIITAAERAADFPNPPVYVLGHGESTETCLLYTSDAADERSSVDLGGRRIIKKTKKKKKQVNEPTVHRTIHTTNRCTNIPSNTHYA